jgi:hypothetical protein
MIRIFLVGMGAAAAAALLFASVTSGAALSVVLFYLAPLPIIIVAVGWTHWAGLIAALAAAAVLGGVFGIFFFATFLTSVGAPAWWLGYLVLLGRPAAANGSARMEWYPPGRLVLWAAIFGAALTATALATFGSDEASIRQGLQGALDQVLRTQTPADTAQQAPDASSKGAQAPATHAPQVPDAQIPGTQTSAGDADPMVDMLARILPPAAAVIATLTQTANLWLAGLVVRLSGRLRRPWPDLTALSFPPLAAVLYGAFLAAALLPGLPGLLAGLFAATLTMAFAMVGFAVTHTVTRGMHGRAAVLWGAYGSVFFLLWPVLIIAIIGVAETLFGLRGRLSGRGPPAANNH